MEGNKQGNEHKDELLKSAAEIIEKIPTIDGDSMETIRAAENWLVQWEIYRRFGA